MIKNNLHLIDENGCLRLGQSIENAHLLSGNPEDIIECLNVLIKSETREDVIKNYSSETKPTLEKIEEFIDVHSNLPIWNNKRTKDRRQLYLDTIGSDLQFLPVVKNTMITIIGVGGVGSSVALELCKLGFLNFNLFDGDIVEQENLFKCLAFDEKSIGKNKADHLSEKLFQINPKVTVKAMSKYYLDSASQAHFLNKSMTHIIVQCADKRMIQVLEKIETEYKDTNSIVVTAGCFEHYVAAGPSLKVSELEAFLSLVRNNKTQKTSDGIDNYNDAIINVGVTSSVLIAASLIVNEIINHAFLQKLSLGRKQVLLNMLTLEMNHHDIKLRGL